MLQALQQVHDRFHRLEVAMKQAQGRNEQAIGRMEQAIGRMEQAIGRTATLVKEALRFTLSNNNSIYSRTHPHQTAFKRALIKRYLLQGNRQGYVICMVTGIALPRDGVTAAHIISVSKFVYARADVPLTDPWDIRNGIMWLGKWCLKL